MAVMVASFIWGYPQSLPDWARSGLPSLIGHSLHTLPLGSRVGHSGHDSTALGKWGCFRVIAREPENHGQSWAQPPSFLPAHLVVTGARILSICRTLSHYSEWGVGAVEKTSEFRSQLHHISWVLLSNTLNFSEPQSFCLWKWYYRL